MGGAIAMSFGNKIFAARESSRSTYFSINYYLFKPPFPKDKI